MTTDNTASPDDVAAALKRDGYYSTQPLFFPSSPASFDTRGTYYFDNAEGKWVCDCSEATPQDDFIHKGRGLLFAFVGCAVFWMLVFLMIGGV